MESFKLFLSTGGGELQIIPLQRRCREKLSFLSEGVCGELQIIPLHRRCREKLLFLSEGVVGELQIILPTGGGEHKSLFPEEWGHSKPTLLSSAEERIYQSAPAIPDGK